MKKTIEITETVTKQKIVSIQCDKCKKEFFTDNESDYFDILEFHNIDFVGGYGSIFGDGIEIQCDFCDKCFCEIIGKFVDFKDAKWIF